MSEPDRAPNHPTEAERAVRAGVLGVLLGLILALLAAGRRARDAQSGGGSK